MGSERFKWSRASTFSYNRNAIGLAVAYASAICTHLSLVVHGTAHHMSAASVRPQSANDCLIERLTSLILFNRETLVQARLLPAILSVAIFSMAIAQVQSGGVAILRFPLAGRATSTVPSSVVSASIPLSPGHSLYLPTQSQASYCNVTSSPSACRPSS